jgi:hypothetical protein
MIMKKTLFIAFISVFLSSCSALRPQPANHGLAAHGVNSDKPTRILRFSAIGYGAESTFSGYTRGQKRLLALRAAKLDAYRSLAEQLYGVRIYGNTTVSAMMTKHDSFRAFIDATIRGARIISITPMSDGNYETTAEVELREDFFERSNALLRGHHPVGMVSSGSMSQVSHYQP